MILKTPPEPKDNETPVEYADRLAVDYALQATREHKKVHGQFFTPLHVAMFLASLEKTESSSVRILDPGCGIGILSAAICQQLKLKSSDVKDIHLTVFETDVEILHYSETCFTYLSNWLEERGVGFTYFLCKNDFVLHNSHILNQDVEIVESYDLVICNPPYFKLPKGDLRIKASRSVIHGQTNIYSIFMIIAAKLLRSGGQFIFITPRSFCSGSYFRLFRKLFFEILELELIHIFRSRDNAFKRDKVQLENIVISGKRKKIQNFNQLQICFGPELEKRVMISSSNGIDDINHRVIKSHPVSKLINFKSDQKILHLPIDDTDERILEYFNQWEGSLSKYNLKISTGPVVDFRSEPFITSVAQSGMVPMIWLHNVFPLQIKWPSTGDKGKPKGQYIKNIPESESRLVPNHNYVLLRRFSSKDDKFRLIAAPHFNSRNPGVKKIGIENHLNYIYHPERELTKEEAMGIAVLLNSRLFDLYFRIFNGNINVSATELRDFPLPDFHLIVKMGKRAIKSLEKDIDIDPNELIKSVFKITLVLPEPK